MRPAAAAAARADEAALGGGGFATPRKPAVKPAAVAEVASAAAGPQSEVASAFEQDALVWASCTDKVWAAGKVISTGSQLVVQLADSDEDEDYDTNWPVDDDDSASLAGPSSSMGASPSRRSRTSGASASASAHWRSPEPPPRQLRVPAVADGTGVGGVQLLRRDPRVSGASALDFDDLTEVPELHEAAVLEALDSRFSRGQIYTLTGPILIAVNPFRSLPGLYSPDTLRRYCAHADRHESAASFGAQRLRPHIFGVANLAFQGIMNERTSQTVLVSGESGAGKTETTKFVMQFLALAGSEGFADDGEEAPGAAVSASGRPLSRVERQVLRSNPLLEAFGNAKTLRNDNSSRFGKYIELQFGGTETSRRQRRQRLIGARIRTYLLEKVRVVDQASGERSFHIFYQALAGASFAAGSSGLGGRGLTPAPGPGAGAAEHGEGASGDGGAFCVDVDVATFKGRTAADFAYLRRTHGITLDNGDDGRDFEATLAAMRTVGFSPSEIQDIIRAVAAVLYLGNISFAAPARNSEGSEVVASRPDGVDERPPASIACELLGMSPEELQGALCTRTMRTPGEGVIHMANTMTQAVESRDALARHLYHAIFAHVVEKTNRSIGFAEGDEALFCGVLDIFGFEFFDTNSFEQLCINFTNELLQQYFNSFIFENETRLYRDEGIAWAEQDFPNNAAIVELLQVPPSGIFPMLDEECFVLGGSSSSWRAKLIRAHDQNPRFAYVKHISDTFVVRHFAGPVTYTTDGFLEKNRDRLSADLVRCLVASRWPFLRARFAEAAAEATMEETTRGSGGGCTPSSPSARARGSSLASPRSPSSALTGRSGRSGTRTTESVEFRQQLRELMAQIRSTTPHFVRCLKANKLSRPFVEDASFGGRPKPLFDRPSIAEQLSYQGVLEAIRVSRAGYPVRLLHADFVRDFRCLLPRSSELRGKIQALAGQLREAASSSSFFWIATAPVAAPPASRFGGGITLLPLPGDHSGAADDAAAAEAAAAAVRLLLGAPEVLDLMSVAAAKEAAAAAGPVGAAGASESAPSAASPVGWTLGRRRVFLKQGPFGALKAAQSRLRNGAAAQLQALERGRAARRAAVSRLRALVSLQASRRGLLARRAARARRRLRAGEVLAANFRTLLSRERFRQARRAAVWAQSMVRSRRDRRDFLRTREATIRLQAAARAWKRRRRLKRLPEDVQLVQRWWRGSCGRRRARGQRLALLRLRSVLRSLVRIRRRNAERRRWRAQMMAFYKGVKSPRRPTGGNTFTLGALVEDYSALERERDFHLAQVRTLRGELVWLQQKVEMSKQGGFLRNLGLL